MRTRKQSNIDLTFLLQQISPTSDVILALNELYPDAKLTDHHLHVWTNGMETDEDQRMYNKFDRLVKNHLTKEVYDAADTCARLPEVLALSLGLKLYVGGDVSKEVAQNETRLARGILRNPAKYAEGF